MKDFFAKGDKNIRGDTINALIETHWEGKRLKGVLSNSPVTNKIIGALLKSAAFSFFAFDFTSALKNHFGATYQIALEAAGKRWLTYGNYMAGRPWASKTMWEISGSIYQKGPKSKNVQLTEIFDASQGRFDDNFGESISRSATRDLVNVKFPTAHRKWLEMEATLQLFSGMMRSTKVTRMVNGEPTEIMYKDAWEVRDGKIQLVEGVDPEWGQEGAKFLEFRNKLHQVNNLLQGAYAPFDQSRVERYAFFKLFNFMKKFFVPMFVHRLGMQTSKGKFGQERYNPGLMEMHKGFYITNISSLVKILRHGLKYIMYMTPDEVRAFKLLVMDFVRMYIIGMIISWLGWDDDDPQRISKLKDRSGALPSFLTDDEWSENWNVGGWLHNHAILLLMHVQGESGHFNPFSKRGMKDMLSIGTTTSIAMAPTIERYIDILLHFKYYITGEKKGFYQKDSGALKTQQEESAKMWRMIQMMFGIKGKTSDPATAIKNYSDAQKK